MIKRLWLCSLLFILCLSASAQFTSVTGTATDSDGQTWNNGKWSVSLYNPYPQSPATVNGTALTPSQMNQSGVMNSSGAFSLTLADNSVVAPTGTHWVFVICPDASAQCSIVSTPIAGGSENISSIINAGITPPAFTANAIAGGAWGYRDSEIHPTPNPGGQYYNSVLGCQRVWNSTSWSCVNNNGIGILDATSFPGSDIGAKINNAYASLPANGGQIYVNVPVGGFSFSTPIVIGTAAKPATITCSSNPGAEQSNGALTFTSTTATAITFDIATSGFTTNAVPRGYGTRGCYFQGSHGTSVGLFLGGANGAQGFSDEGSTFNGFGTDALTGANTFFVKFTGTYFGEDITGVLFNNPAATNAGEEILFDGVTFHEGGAGAVQIYGAQATMTGVAFDNSQLVAASSYTSCVGCHFENPDSGISYPFILSSGNTSIINTQLLDDHPSVSTATSAISVTGGTTVIIGLDGVFQNAAYASVIDVSGNANVFETNPTALINTMPLTNGATTGRYIMENDPLCRTSGNPAICATYVSNLPTSTTNEFGAGVPETGYQQGGFLGQFGTRVQSTPDNVGFYTGKYRVARDVADGCNSYASELDLYTENKAAGNTTDTSTIAGRIDCHGYFHAVGGVISPTLSLNKYTIAGLPSAVTLGAGAQVIVTDSMSFTSGACVGGGTDYMIAVSDGATWSCH